MYTYMYIYTYTHVTHVSWHFPHSAAPTARAARRISSIRISRRRVTRAGLAGAWVPAGVPCMGCAAASAEGAWEGPWEEWAWAAEAWAEAWAEARAVAWAVGWEGGWAVGWAAGARRVGRSGLATGRALAAAQTATPRAPLATSATRPSRSAFNIKRSTGHTHTHTDREQHPATDTHIQTTRTTPQTPKRTPPQTLNHAFSRRRLPVPRLELLTPPRD